MYNDLIKRLCAAEGRGQRGILSEAAEAMADYIDRQRLLRDPYFQENRYPQSHLLRMAIMEQPTADVAPVVRCKDCKHWHLSTGFCDKHSYFVDSDGLSCSPAESPNWIAWEPFDFCSDSERKEG